MELKEAEKLYGDVNVKFSSYYKYTFTFEGLADDGSEVVCCYGGNSDDIYRYGVSSSEEIPVGKIALNWSSIWIHKDGNDVFSYNNY